MSLSIEGHNCHRYVNYQIKDNGVFLYNQEAKKYLYLCRYLKVIRVETNIVTGDVQVELEYVHNQEIKTMTLPREVFVKSKLLNVLPAKGLDVTDFNVTKVLEYLLCTEEEAEHFNIHENLGWTDINGKLVYLHHNVIGGGFNSSYKGQLNIAPKGNRENFNQLIEQEVLGHPPLELALALGLSSPVASRLRKLLGLDVLFFHIYGNSTTGKTTALMLATAPFGYPSKYNNGLIRTWLATDNALLGLMKGLHGMPLAIDEASSKVNSEYTKMIYQIVDGIEKARADKNGVVKKRNSNDEWSGTVASTAENSLLGNSNHNNGLRVRLLELGHIQWTKSAENAEKLKAGLLENYSHVGVNFISYLNKIDDESLIKLFKECKQQVLERITAKDAFTDRIADKIAVVYLTAKVARKALNINFDHSKILDLLIEADKQQSEDRKLHLKAYEFFKSEVTRNINKFVFKDDVETYDMSKRSYQDKLLPAGELMGRIEMLRDKMSQVLIPREQLNKILQSGGFTDVEGILYEWRENQVIDADKGKFTRKRKLFKKGVEQRVVVVNLDNKLELED
ncbi:DUF927 domain-containing protein [Geosporobacter ferrireducens]|uniref:DUF927 domain-containing protein n=1 Tax=Geosporobacter ferrireducens TaxID=1424294 RepID=A0A1D8GPH9_9FIRM|nr:DUF927 domain-containing protein [Geosporobacter ferrireducens]AOT72805.1 hypothetical protein Gferi_26550 [Geosporobacter ferrireducens]